MNRVRKIFLFFTVLSIISSCYYDNEEDYYQNIVEVNTADCITTNMSFSNDIIPIISDNCFGCHSETTFASLGNNINLEGHSNVLISVNNGSLYGSVSGDENYISMPQGGSNLDNCAIKKINSWIQNGAPNN